MQQEYMRLKQEDVTREKKLKQCVPLGCDLRAHPGASNTLLSTDTSTAHTLCPHNIS